MIEPYGNDGIFYLPYNPATGLKIGESKFEGDNENQIIREL